VDAIPTEELTVPQARPRDWVGLGLLAVPCMLISANSNLLNLALPALAADLQPTSTQLLWISDIYVFLVAGLLLPMGLLADRLGRRRLLFVGATVFGLASLGAALSFNATSLIICRGLIGVGSAMLGPSTLSLIRSMFRIDRQRAVALGIWTASFALGGILAPLIGGLLIEVVSWRAVFIVTPAAMVILLVLGPFVLPEYRSDTVRHIDVLGVSMAILGLLATTYAVKQVSSQAASLLTSMVGVVGVVLLVAFVQRQRRVAHPVLALDLFADRAYTVPLVGNAVAFGVLFGTQLLIGQYLQAVLGMSPLEAGLWTIPSAAAYAIGGLLAPRLGARMGTGRLLAAGLALSALGFGIVAAIGTDTGLLVFVLGSVVYSLGLAPVYQVTTDSSVAAVPAERSGAAGATLETVTNLGGALGIALFGSLAAATYRVGTGGSETTTETIGDALAQAERLPSTEADSLVEAARVAFVNGFRLVEVIGAALLLVSAIATPSLLREPRRASSGTRSLRPPHPARRASSRRRSA
jgi:MFS transporter, DHA2 family, multidrug resistance protein